MPNAPDPAEPLVRIGRALKRLRKRRNYTQQVVGERAGLDRSYVGGVERGARNLSALALGRMLLALDATWTELASLIDNEGPSTGTD